MTSARPRSSVPHPDSEPAGAPEPALASATALPPAVPAGWPPPGTAYHRLGPPVGRGRWRAAATAVAGLLVLVAGLLVLVAGLTALSLVIDRLPAAGLPLLGAWTNVAVQVAAIGLLAPVVLVLAGPAQRRPAATVWSVTGRLRWALLAQELLFRSLVMQAVGGFFASPWPAVIIQAGLWTMVHWPSSLWGAVNVACVGLMLGMLTVRTGGLEAAIAAHLAWNGVTYGLLVAFYPPPSGQAPVDQNMGDLPAAMAIFDLALVAAALYLIYLWAIDRNEVPGR